MYNTIPICVHDYFSLDSTCLHLSDCGPEVNGTDWDEVEDMICHDWHCVDNICRCTPSFGGFGGGFGDGADGGGFGDGADGGGFGDGADGGGFGGAPDGNWSSN